MLEISGERGRYLPNNIFFFLGPIFSNSGLD